MTKKLIKDYKIQVSYADFAKHFVPDIANDLNPTENFELLKIHRQNMFEKSKQNYIKESKLNNLIATDLDINRHYLIWLKDELKTIDNWLSPQRKPTPLTTVQINKYRDFVNNEIEKAKDEKKINTKTLQEIFIVENWQKYIDILTTCEPKLLRKENNNYKFIGNKKTQKGCIAQWFKTLKIKGIIDQSIDRGELASVLSSEIIDFSINGSTIDNVSTNYKTTFEKQLEVTLK